MLTRSSPGSTGQSRSLGSAARRRQMSSARGARSAAATSSLATGPYLLLSLTSTTSAVPTAPPFSLSSSSACPSRRTRSVAARAVSAPTPFSSASTAEGDSSSSFRAPGTPVAAPTTPLFLQLLIESLFNFPPVFNSAVKAARSKIAQRGLSVGVDIEAYAEELKRAKDWDAAMKEIEDSKLVYPRYYLEPFHCYETGNLNWESALEGPASSKAGASFIGERERCERREEKESRDGRKKYTNENSKKKKKETSEKQKTKQCTLPSWTPAATRSSPSWTRKATRT